MNTVEPPRPGHISRGMGWATAGQVGAEGLRVITGFALARFMTPEEFGLVGMVTVFANYASVLLNFGLGSALVQRRHASLADLSTVFWVNVLVGVILTGSFVASSSLVAEFYGRPELKSISSALALNFLLLAPSIVHRTMLQRDLRFRGLAIVDLAATVVSSVLALGLGAAGWGPWSLVAWTLSRSAIQTLGSIALYRWLPSLQFRVESVREMIGFAANVTASETLGYIAANVDRLLVGRYLGAHAVGIYEQAVRLMMLPIANTSMVLGRVLFPALARLQDDPERARGVYLRSVRNSMFLAAPALIGLLVAAKPFVAVAYGPGWDDLVPVLRLTAITGLGSTLLALATSVFRSTGRANLELRVGLPRRLLGVVFACIGVWWNVAAVAFGRLVAVFLGVFAYQRVIGRLLGVPLRAQLANVGSIALSATALAGSLVVVGYAGSGLSDPVVLAVDVCVGGCVYLGVAWLVSDRSLKELRALAGFT